MYHDKRAIPGSTHDLDSKHSLHRHTCQRDHPTPATISSGLSLTLGQLNKCFIISMHVASNGSHNPAPEAHLTSASEPLCWGVVRRGRLDSTALSEALSIDGEHTAFGKVYTALA